MKPVALLSCLAALFGSAAGAAQSWTVGPFTVEAIERQISAGGFPNTSGNPFKRRPVTTFRVLHNGKQVVPAGTEPGRGGPWWDARVIGGASQPALLLMEAGAVLLTEQQGQAHVQELAPRDGARSHWQWLDNPNGQPSALELVGIGHRPDHALHLTGGRWLNIFSQAVVDTQTLAVYRYKLNSTPVLNQLGRFYAADEPALAFSPGGTQFVALGARERPGESDIEKRFEFALVAFDYANQQGTVLPIALKQWRLPNRQGIDTAFAQRVLGWRRGADGREQAYLRDDLPPQPWLGRLAGREMQSLSYSLQPALPSMRETLAKFLETEFGAVIVPRDSVDVLEARIKDLTLSLGFLRPAEQRLSLFHSGDWQRQAEAHALIERVAERFNARLAAGQYQQHFVADTQASTEQVSIPPAPASDAKRQ